MIPLTCPVRNCAERLVLEPMQLRCAHGHSFDRAKSGYFNLLQPQDRKAQAPGDAKSGVLARRRALDAGTGAHLLASLKDILRSLNLSAPGTRLVDVGCGEGYFASQLASDFQLDACGIDISVAAIDAAAKRYPDQQWLVANGDKQLPLPEQCVQILTSITSCKNSREFRRLLAPQGRLLLVVSGADDLHQLREAIHGKALEADRVARMLEIFGADFELESKHKSSATMRLSPDTLRDLLMGTYRGARRNAQERVAELSEMQLTLSYDVLVLKAVCS